MKISMKLVHQYMAIFLNFSPTSGHLHPLQVKNCDNNLRLVVDEDDYGKLRLERVNINPLLPGPVFSYIGLYLRLLIGRVGNLYQSEGYDMY